MKAATRRFALWGGLTAVLSAGLVWSFRPTPVPVDLVAVDRGLMRVTVDEEGETRVRDVFVLSAPVTGRARRIEAEPGDLVAAGDTVVAEIEPADPAFLDVRSEAESRAALRAAEADRALATAELDSARAELEFARAEYRRVQGLFRQGVVSQRALDDAERLERTRRAAVDTAQADLRRRTFEVDRARARLVSPADTPASGDHCGCIPIRAPVSGRVLRVLHESEGVVQAGEPLLEIGDPRDLEIVADLLSSDAVRVEPGQRVLIEDWGGAVTLKGRVQRVEPYAFTKVSALGIEEQRVNVVIELIDPAERWQRLGHGYRVEVRIVLWESGEARKVPLTALFRDDGRWAVFVATEGRARRRWVTVGHDNGLEAEIQEGLEAGELVVRHLSDRLREGTRITARNDGRVTR